MGFPHDFLDMNSRRRKVQKRILSLIIFLGLAFAGLSGQDKPAAFDKAEKKAVIDALCENLDREYIFPDITEKYIRMLKDNLQSGKYDGIGEPPEFARVITGDLMAIHRDGHLSIRYNPAWVKNEKGRKELDDAAIAFQKRQDRNSNYGFQEIKILPGNIGYFKFDGFTYNTDGIDAAVGAMGFLSNADALIIDLRANGGGSPEMVQLLCSYFLDNPTKHLNSFSYKDKEKLTQYWTYTYLPGKRLDKADLYLLTSRGTFSAAEEFAYNLKNLKRAVIVGETTGGGAHDNKFVILTDNFMMSLPFARAVNPITKSNWEEVGVEPDIKVSQNKALETALAMAARKLMEKEKDPRFKAFYEWHFEVYQAALNPMTIDEAKLKSYAGTYGPRMITLEGGSLYYQRQGQAKAKMIPISDNYFKLAEFENLRLKFIKDGDRVVSVEAHNPTGVIDNQPKAK
jgi:retinol-binding protein 3